jgi:hypothetical protein
MSGLVTFDQKGVFGPAMTLIYNSKYYNEKGLSDLSSLLKIHFMYLAGTKPTGRKEFCAFVIEANNAGKSLIPLDIIKTRFFQSMQKHDPSPQVHEKVLCSILPDMINSVIAKIPEAGSAPNNAEVHEWVAHLLETYLTEEQIQKHVEPQGPDAGKILEERQKIGGALYEAAGAKLLTKKDLVAIIETLGTSMKALEQTDDYPMALKFTGQYLNFFSMQKDNPSALGKDVIDKLSTVFMKKFFPNE